MIVDNLFLAQDLTQIQDENLSCFGYMITGNKPIAGVPKHIQDGYWWMLDNGAFTKAGFIQPYWVGWLDHMKPYQDKCVCVVIPDVVGKCQETLEQFPEYAPMAKERGYKVALVTQNGMTKDMLPWDDFDVLFVGGDDDHKMGREAGFLIDYALQIGKHVHVGRVNTEYRLLHFWRCHTWDGSSIVIKPEKYEPIVVSGVKAVIEKKKQMESQPSLFNLF